MSSDAEALAPVVTPLKGIRRTIARRMAKAWEIPVFHLSITVDMRSILERRAGVPGASVTDMLLRDCATSLALHPALNAHFVDDSILEFDRQNVAFAVATDRGVLVPVIQDAGSLSNSELVQERKRLLAVARGNVLTPADFANGTFAKMTTPAGRARGSASVPAPAARVTQAAGISPDTAGPVRRGPSRPPNATFWRSNSEDRVVDEVRASGARCRCETRRAVPERHVRDTRAGHAGSTLQDAPHVDGDRQMETTESAAPRHTPGDRPPIRAGSRPGRAPTASRLHRVLAGLRIGQRSRCRPAPGQEQVDQVRCHACESPRNVLVVDDLLDQRRSQQGADGGHDPPSRLAPPSTTAVMLVEV